MLLVPDEYLVAFILTAQGVPSCDPPYLTEREPIRPTSRESRSYSLLSRLNSTPSGAWARRFWRI